MDVAVPMTRRQKIRANKIARAEAYAKMTPEQQSEYNAKRAAKRAKRRMRPRKVNTNSRSYRWSAAIGQARAAIDAMEAAKSDFESAWGEIAEIRQEFQDWYDNLGDSLQQGPTGQKLDELLNTVDEDAPEIDIDAATEAVDNAEGVDLPLGWGRD
jgi:hypothetical protein